MDKINDATLLTTPNRVGFAVEDRNYKNLDIAKASITQRAVLLFNPETGEDIATIELTNDGWHEQIETHLASYSSPVLTIALVTQADVFGDVWEIPVKE